MKPVIKKRGIILNSKDYKDNFKLLTILTIDGPMHVILKGANKMSSGTKNIPLHRLKLIF
ncbi:MAG: recombination protein O N-terminal domain-containing protein [Christensenellales bacterium]